MVVMDVTYAGNLRCEVVHGPSGSRIETDAPTDNHGRGERLSPTDLIASALATCLATTLGIVAGRKNWNLTGMRVRVEKHMAVEGPRRIARLPLTVQMPAGFPVEARAEAEGIMRACPVHRCLHPEIDAPVAIVW